MSATPTAKKVCCESTQEQVCNHIIQQFIFIHNSFNEKVKHLEAKIDSFISNMKVILSENLNVDKKSHCCDEVLKKLSDIEKIVCNISSDTSVRVKCNDKQGPVVLLPTQKPSRDGEGDSITQVMTLNTEADYPNGSWLGDDRNPEARVRVAITPSQLIHINTVCTTPEKMAVVLLDYLFPQETQAKSNLSGKGKHFKEQLDPLKIYGIKSHLMYKFNISERDWYRIKQNIDSKCRTAWRKKAMGLPLSKNKVQLNDDQTHDKNLKRNSLVLAGTYISEDHSQELPSMIIEDKECFTLTGCCEQSLTIITDSGEMSVPILNAEGSLSDDQNSSQEILSLP